MDGTTANPATLVVNVSGGTGPFTYQLDGNSSVSSAATTCFFLMLPRNHTILVTDGNNCTAQFLILTLPQLVSMFPY
jgi:hypothetical protein